MWMLLFSCLICGFVGFPYSCLYFSWWLRDGEHLIEFELELCLDVLVMIYCLCIVNYCSGYVAYLIIGLFSS